MKLLKLIIVGAAMASAMPGYAQYAGDALNFSRTQYGSTARMKAAGGAFTAVGGDLSSVSGNPAGVGFFTRSEFSLTPQYTTAKNNSSFLGNSTTGEKDNVNLNNLTAVFYLPAYRSKGADNTKGWLSFNIGLGVARTNDFTGNIAYSGTNERNSIADYFTELADSRGVGVDIDAVQSSALSQGLISGNAQDGFQPAVFTQGNAQSQSFVRSGGQSDINLSLGTNYSNKLYLGLSLGVSTLRYNFDGVYTESGEDIDNIGFTTQYSQSQRTSGTGVNAKLGMIFKPVDQFRIGATVSTPTWYSIDDSYAQTLLTTFQGEGQYSNDPNQYDLNYRLKTPWKLSGGAAVFLNQYGFISADIDYVDYSSIKLSNYDNVEDTQQIGQNYKSAINYRLGAEVNLKNAFFLRGGYNVSGNPYANRNNSDFDIKTISGGLGYRFQNYYLDLTYQHVKNSDFSRPYDITPGYFFYNESGDGPVADVNRKADNVFLTFGVRF